MGFIGRNHVLGTCDRELGGILDERFALDMVQMMDFLQMTHDRARLDRMLTWQTDQDTVEREIAEQVVGSKIGMFIHDGRRPIVQATA